jgi:hypothetical protein
MFHGLFFLCGEFLCVLSSSCVSVLFFRLKSFLFAFLLVLFDAIAIIMARVFLLIPDLQQKHGMQISVYTCLDPL